VAGGAGSRYNGAFNLAFELARVLYADGFPCIGDSCPSNDHVNERVRDFTPGRMHSDPGYALTHNEL
jgi:hypothetical protein